MSRHEPSTCWHLPRRGACPGQVRKAGPGRPLRRRLALPFASLALLALLAPLGACSSAPIRKEGEADLRFWPTGARWRQASVNALRDPITWGSAAGAAAIAAGGWDGKISHWAVTKTPLFGSIDNAKKRSDDLRALCNFAMLGTALAVPGGDYPWRSRIERLLVEEAGVISASTVTGQLKETIPRERPDESDNHSLPSGHSTRAFAYNGMSSRNLDAMDLPDPVRDSLKGLFTALAAGTGWARIEGERHYPTDVLAGAAVGNFMSLFIHDAFLGRTEKVSVSVRADHEERGLQVRIVLP